MKLKYPSIALIVLIVVLILISGFFIYEGLRKQKIEEEDYVVEEVIEEEDIVPDETADIPTVEGGEEVEVLNEVTINIHNGKFYPDELTVSPGTTVIWNNTDSFPHKLVAYDRIFYSPRLQPGDKYLFTFTQAGTHRYFDAIFPKAGKGVVIVKEEPLPITGGVIIDLNKKEADGKFALLVLLFVIMIFGLSHGMYKHRRI